MANAALTKDNSPAGLVKFSMNKLIACLPGNREQMAKRFQQAAIAVAMSPNIQDCEPNSVVSAIYACARLNLIPDPVLKQAHIVPFKERGVKKAQLIIGYSGIIMLARRAAPALQVQTGSVYENDDYELIEGTTTELRIRKRWWQLDKPNCGKFLFAYCISSLPGQDKQLTVVSRQDGQRLAAGKSEYTPWFKGGPMKDTGVASDFPAMCEKTAIRRASKTWTLNPDSEESVKFMEAISRDDDETAQPLVMPNDGEDDMPDLKPNAPKPPPAPAEGKVKTGSVPTAGLLQARKSLIKQIEDRLIDANIEPSPENVEAVYYTATKTPIEELSQADILDLFKLIEGNDRVWIVNAAKNKG